MVYKKMGSSQNSGEFPYIRYLLHLASSTRNCPASYTLFYFEDSVLQVTTTLKVMHLSAFFSATALVAAFSPAAAYLRPRDYALAARYAEAESLAEIYAGLENYRG